MFEVEFFVDRSMYEPNLSRVILASSFSVHSTEMSEWVRVAKDLKLIFTMPNHERSVSRFINLAVTTQQFHRTSPICTFNLDGENSRSRFQIAHHDSTGNL